MFRLLPDRLRTRISAGNIRTLILYLLIPAISFYALEWFTHNPWTTMKFKIQLWNILFYELIFLLLYLILGRIRAAACSGTILFALIGTINYYVMDFRSAPIVPWDIYSLVTAASVADNYDYTPTIRSVLVWAVFLVLLFLSFRFLHGKTKLRIRNRLIGVAAVLFLLTGYIALLSSDDFIRDMNLDNTLFTPHVMARKNGFCVSYLMDLRYLRVDSPSGYSEEDTEELLQGYEENTAADTDELPNIIVIMDEAFSDPAVLGSFETNQDYMPYVHSLMESDSANVLSGYLNVSVKGGNTANTEFEFLTGNTMRFLPGGSVPYQQYIFGEKVSLVSWLETLGYRTAATHPYNSTGWCRDKVYDYFGFDEIVFNTGYHYPERIRKYISDRACFDKILSLMEEDSDAPAFVFAVTMQNHSSYTEQFDNFTPDITVNDAPVGTSTTLLQNYLSLMKITDGSLRELIQTLETADRKTVVVFFGDHQPNDIVIESIWKMNGTSSSVLTDDQADLRYKVPYVVWANYDLTPSSIDSETSVNYLAEQVLKAAGLPLSSWQQAEDEIRSTVPVLTTQRCSDSTGVNIDENDPEVADALQRYRKIQYYQMFDR